MTWAEFQIRAYAYRRMQEREDLRAREIAWASLVAPNIDGKKLPKSKDKFWSIGRKKPIDRNKMEQAILKAQQEYLKAKDGIR